MSYKITVTNQLFPSGNPQKVPAIKAVREILNCGLKEAKDFVEGVYNVQTIDAINTAFNGNGTIMAVHLAPLKSRLREYNYNVVWTATDTVPTDGVNDELYKSIRDSLVKAVDSRNYAVAASLLEILRTFEAVAVSYQGSIG